MAATVYKVTPEQIQAELDRLAREKLGISGQEFVERYNEGTLDGSSPTVAELAILARLLTQPS